MEWFMGYIKNLCVFTLIITLILNIFPESNYKKYIKLFAGFLLLVIIMQPIIRMRNLDYNPENFLGDITLEEDTGFLMQESEIESIMSERIQENNETSGN